MTLESCPGSAQSTDGTAHEDDVGSPSREEMRVIEHTQVEDGTSKAEM